MFVVCGLVCVVCWLMFVGVFVVVFLVFVVCCAVCVGCWLLVTVCCLLFVVS